MSEEFEEEYSGAESFEEKDARKRRKGCFLGIISVLAVLVMLFCLSMKTIVPTNWTHFSSKRIDFIEEKYKISLDNADPERYREVAIAQDGDSYFNFEVGDYRSFMENDFRGEIKQEYESPDGSSAEYKCRIDDRLCCIIKFTKYGSRYKGDLICYRDAVPTDSSTLPYLVYSNG